MSSNTAASTSGSASSAANQALIALIARINEMIEEVLRSQSEEEKMGLSRKIAREVVCFFSIVIHALYSY
jgi:hypothetical protein